MAATVANSGSSCANLDGGRPVHPAITSLEAHVEAIVAISNDVEALHHLAHLQAQMNRLGARLSQLAIDRAERLERIVLPELRAGYSAAEIAYAGSRT